MKLLLDLSYLSCSSSAKHQGGECMCSVCFDIYHMSSGQDEPPSPYDILCERDKRYCQHYGNTVFRGVISTYQPLYAKAGSKDEKMRITKEIVHVLRTTYKSRFIKLNQDNEWEEISDRSARDKVSHALRFAGRPRKGRGGSAASKTTPPKKAATGKLPPLPKCDPPSLKRVASGARSAASPPTSSSSHASTRLRSATNAALTKAASLVMRKSPDSMGSPLSDFGESSVGAYFDDAQQSLFLNWDVEKEDLNNRSEAGKQQQFAHLSRSSCTPVPDDELHALNPFLDYEPNDIFCPAMGQGWLHTIVPGAANALPFSRGEERAIGAVDGGVALRGNPMLHDDLQALASLMSEPIVPASQTGYR